MHKGLNILTALLLCANIAVGAQDENSNSFILTRNKYTDSENMILHLSSDVKCGANEVYFRISEVKPDYYPMASGTISLLTSMMAAYCYWKHGNSIIPNLLTGTSILSILGTVGLMAANDASTNGKYLLKTERYGSLYSITLKNTEGKWNIIRQICVPNEIPQLHHDNAENLAIETIANHNSDVKDEDLYASEIFQKLVSDFKARG